MRGDAGSNPAGDTKFLFHFREVCLKPLVSYLHPSIIGFMTLKLKTALLYGVFIWCQVLRD